jgi:predicted HAD superfamily Cof-like phosphohydrolase
MNKIQEQVLEFHKVFGAHIETKPTIPPFEVRTSRLRLIFEEFKELCNAFGVGTDLPDMFEVITDGECDLVKAADGLGDLSYVIHGGAINCGIDLDPITNEIHNSNMTKINGHMDDHGKWIKGNDYTPVNLLPILKAQGM